MLAERWKGKDTSTPAFLGSDVRVMKWKALKGGKDGILEFTLVPELALVEGLTYVFELQQGGFPFYVGTEAGFGNAFNGLEVEGNGGGQAGRRPSARVCVRCCKIPVLAEMTYG